MAVRPIVAVVGRPNVGKSTLFNKLIGQRLSIVEDTPGVTRDRIYAACEWRSHEIMLVDTGGIEPYSDDIILSQMRRQAEMAIESAQVIILVVDVKSGVTATDQEVAAMLQKSNKPVVLCVNKCDGVGEVPPEFYEFYNLGLGDPVAVSSVHGHGTGDLLDAVYEHLDFSEEDGYDDDSITVAIVGRPNAGKSSLVNRIAGREAVIVSDIAGTPRDTVVERVGVGRVLLRLTDTAGIREAGDAIEALGVARSEQAAREAELALFVCDASQPLTDEDRRAIEAAKCAPRSLALCNKSDLPAAVSPDELPFDTVLTVSARTGAGLDALPALLEGWFLGENACDGSLLTNPRQFGALDRASRAIERAKTGLGLGVTPDAVLTDVEEAMAALGEVTGRTVREDITNRIFERFCVGK